MLRVKRVFLRLPFDLLSADCGSALWREPAVLFCRHALHHLVMLHHLFHHHLHHVHAFFHDVLTLFGIHAGHLTPAHTARPHAHAAALAAHHSHHGSAHAAHCFHVFLHGLHVFLHQFLAFLRIPGGAGFVHLLLHDFHVVLHLGHALVHVHAHRRSGRCGFVLCRHEGCRQNGGGKCSQQNGTFHGDISCVI